MAKIVDARGKACPFPVVLTKKALEEADEVVTIVDNPTAQENVSRLGESQKCRVNVARKADGIYLTLKKPEAKQEEQQPTAVDVVLLIASELFGRGDNPQLGSLLMSSFLNTLDSLTVTPQTVIFVNSGVKLVAGESPAVEALRRLAEQGVEILACGTCLSRYDLTDKVAVGQVSNMHVIADTLLRASKVVSL